MTPSFEVEYSLKFLTGTNYKCFNEAHKLKASCESKNTLGLTMTAYGQFLGFASPKGLMPEKSPIVLPLIS